MSKVDLSRPQSVLGLSRKRPTASNPKPQTFCECPERKTGPSPCAQQSPIFETRVGVQQSVRTHPEHAEHALDCSHHASDCSFLPCARRSTLVGSPGGTCRDKFQGFSSFGPWAVLGRVCERRSLCVARSVGSTCCSIAAAGSNGAPEGTLLRIWGLGLTFIGRHYGLVAVCAACLMIVSNLCKGNYPSRPPAGTISRFLHFSG